MRKSNVVIFLNPFNQSNYFRYISLVISCKAKLKRNVHALFTKINRPQSDSNYKTPIGYGLQDSDYVVRLSSKLLRKWEKRPIFTRIKSKLPCFMNYITKIACILPSCAIQAYFTKLCYLGLLHQATLYRLFSPSYAI